MHRAMMRRQRRRHSAVHFVRWQPRGILLRIMRRGVLLRRRLLLVKLSLVLLLMVLVVEVLLVL